MHGNNLSRLKSLQQERPSKLINLIRLEWPQIKAAIERGHTLKRIHERLLEDGIRISYGLLTVYVKRFSAKDKGQHRRQQISGDSSDTESIKASSTVSRTNWSIPDFSQKASQISPN